MRKISSWFTIKCKNDIKNQKASNLRSNMIFLKIIQRKGVSWVNENE